MTARDSLIDAYYRAVDGETYETFDRIFTSDSRHVRPGQGVLDGPGAVRAHYEDVRTATKTTHRVLRRYHDEAATLCVVVVSGENPGGSFARPVVGEFTFEDSDIASYQVYRGHPDGREITPR